MSVCFVFGLFEDLFVSIHRFRFVGVLLGSPGGSKSTLEFSTFFICDGLFENNVLLGEDCLFVCVLFVSPGGGKSILEFLIYFFIFNIIVFIDVLCLGLFICCS